MDIREAVDALKTASRVFGSLASVGEAAETARKALSTFVRQQAG